MQRRRFLQAIGIGAAAVAAPTLFLPKIEPPRWRRGRGGLWERTYDIEEIRAATIAMYYDRNLQRFIDPSGAWVLATKWSESDVARLIQQGGVSLPGGSLWRE